MEVFWRDIEFGFRQLWRSPIFSIVAIGTLAIGIGANTAIFSFVNAVLLRPLPYPEAHRLAIIWSGLGYSNRAPVSSFELFQIQQRAKEFEQIAGIWVTNGSLPASSQTEEVGEQVKVGVVTANLLPLLCAKPALGRFFTAEDNAPNAPPTLIISHAIWVRRFGSDPSVIGRSIRIGRRSTTVIGVLPENFRFLFPDDASVPPTVDIFYTTPVDASDPGGPAFLHMIGRLRQGSTLVRAQAEADRIAKEVNSLSGRSDFSHFRLYVFSLQGDDVREVRTTLLLLFGSVALVLLIGCANVANLLMTRATQRLREMTTRAALGASRQRLAQQLLTESILLGCFAAIASLAVAWAAMHALFAARPPSLANLTAVTIDWRVLAFTCGTAAFISVLFGLAPAFVLRRVDLAYTLKESGRQSALGPRRWSRVLVSAEVALAFVLLLGTGLLMRTFLNVLHIYPGFRPENVITFRISGANYNMLHRLQQNLASAPGVESVAAVSHLPLEDAGNWYDYYWKEGAPAEYQTSAMTDLRSVLPGYFRTIGATLLAGRDFKESDDAAHQHVAVIDDVLASQLWPHENAIGKKLNISDSPSGPYQFQRDWVVVIGIVRHVQYHSLTAIVRPQVYLPFQLAPRPNMAIVIHTAIGAPNLAALARKQVAILNRDAAMSRVQPLSEIVAWALSEARFASTAASLLSGIALLLACVGIYGVLAYSVVQRTAELGLRMALGARRSSVMRMILADGLASVWLGLAAGFLLSLMATPMLQHLLFGIKPGNATNYGTILLLMLVVSALAAFIPARRATNIDPLAALRHE